MLTDFVSKHEVFGKIDVAIAEQGEKLINLPGIFSKGLAGKKSHPALHLPLPFCGFCLTWQVGGGNGDTAVLCSMHTEITSLQGKEPRCGKGTTFTLPCSSFLEIRSPSCDRNSRRVISGQDQVQTKQNRCCKWGYIFCRSDLCKQAEPPSQKATVSDSSRCTTAPTPAVNLSLACPLLCSSGRTAVEHLTAGKATYELQVRDEALCNHSTSKYLAFQRTTMCYIRWQGRM